MFTVKIMNEFIHSPLWLYDELVSKEKKISFFRSSML